MSDERSETIDGAEPDLEAMVAHYAPIGRQLRRQRRLAWIGLALLVPILGITAILVIRPGSVAVGKARIESDAGQNLDRSAERVERALAEVRNLKAALEARSGEVTAERAELARQQKGVNAQKRKLAAQLAAMNAQRKTLVKQGKEIEGQKLALVRALEKANEQRRRLQASTGPRISIERELLAIDARKRSLEEQQRQFIDQGQQLAKEVARINQQRAEIETQRQAVEAQQAEMQKLREQDSPADASGPEQGRN